MHYVYYNKKYYGLSTIILIFNGKNRFCRRIVLGYEIKKYSMYILTQKLIPSLNNIMYYTFLIAKIIMTKNIVIHIEVLVEIRERERARERVINLSNLYSYTNTFLMNSLKLLLYFAWHFSSNFGLLYLTLYNGYPKL